LQNPASTGSFALQQEFTDAIKDFKESGKKVVFYYDNILVEIISLPLL
jgi:hypothetical protein